MAGSSRSGGNRTSSDDNFPIDGLPAKPANWGRDEGAVWAQLLRQIPAELLRRVDAFQLKILCELVVRETHLAAACRVDPLSTAMTRSHLQTAQQIGRLSAMFGLSPIDRRRIRLEPTSEGDSVVSDLMDRLRGSV